MDHRIEFGEFDTTPEQDRADIAYARAKSWQAILDDTTKPEQIDFVVNRAIRELDKAYPYIGRKVFISGNSLTPEINQEDGRFLGESWVYNTGLEGVHNGFNIVYREQDGKITRQIMQEIIIGSSQTMPARTIYQELTLFAYFDLDSNILPQDQIDEIFYKDTGPIEFDAQIETLVESSLAINALIKSTKFRRQTRQKQQQAIDNLINLAEEQSKLRGSQMLIEGSYAYINIFTKNVNLFPIDIAGEIISGTCLGIESIHSLKLRKQAIRRDADLIDDAGGLCLMIDPDRETKAKLNIQTKKSLYLPVNQDLELGKIAE